MYTVRTSTIADAETIAGHRRSMFCAMGYRDEAALNQMSDAFLAWVKPRLASGDYVGWFAVAPDGKIAGGAGVLLVDWPPTMNALRGNRAMILNVYTDPVHRRRGIARRLMDGALAWCREHRIESVNLHASDEGASLYSSMGFSATNEMRLLLRQ